MLATEQSHPLLGEVNLLFDSKEQLKSEDTLEAEQEAAEEADEDEELYVDFRLHESARILADLIGLKMNTLIAQASEKK